MKNVVYDFIITEAIETASPMDKVMKTTKLNTKISY